MFSLLYQLISLTALSLFFFTRNKAALYLPYDGAYMQQVVKLHFEWSLPTTNVILSPLQGLGGITFPLNYWFSPSSLVSYLLKGTTPDSVILYTVVTLEFFLSMLFLAHALGASRRVTTLAAWTATLLVMPFALPPSENKLTFYAISGLIPWIIEHIAISNVIIALLVLLRTAKPRMAVLYAVFILAAFVVSLVALPFSIVLSIPLLAVFFFYALSAKPFAFMGRGPSTVFVLGFLALAALPMVYILALLLHTVPSFFNSELLYGRGSWVYISILFHNLFGVGWLSSIVYVTGIAGGVLAWRHATGTLREVARIYVLYALALITTGILLTFGFTWYRGPTILYFEWFSWPLIFLYMAVFLETIFRRCGHYLLPVRLRNIFVTGRIARFIPTALAAPFLIAVGILLVNGSGVMKVQMPVPPVVTPLAETLISRCALAPGEPWRGSVATFTGLAQGKASTSWSVNAEYDIALWKETGNDHRATGLWWHGVPTLFSYNQYLNPEYYYTMTRLFASERDSQQRSVVVLTKPDAHLLGLFGVRFVVTESELPPGEPAKLLQRYAPWNAFSSTHSRSGQPPPLLLYELDRPNLGDFSPTEQLVEPTAAGSLAIIQAPGFQPEQSVVLTSPLEGELHKANEASFIWEKDGITVRGQSDGQSLLVLPLQYSTCLEIEQQSGAAANQPARLVRADLVLTGVLFTNRLDAKIRYNFGPFSQPLCRVQDYFEAKGMHLGADARPLKQQ